MVVADDDSQVVPFRFFLRIRSIERAEEEEEGKKETKKRKKEVHCRRARKPNPEDISHFEVERERRR